MKATRQQTPEDTESLLSEGTWKQPSDLTASHHTSTFHQEDQWQGSEVCCTPGRSVRADSEPVHKVAVASPGGHRHHRGSGGRGEGGGRTLASSMERYPQLFAESLSTFGSEATHKAILSQITRGVINDKQRPKRQTAAETTDQNLLFNDAVFTAPIYGVLITWRIYCWIIKDMKYIMLWFLTKHFSNILNSTWGKSERADG